MSWDILGVTSWTAVDPSDGLPISGTRAWPAGADEVGDVGVLVLAAREATSPPSGLDDWTLIGSFTGGNTDSIGLRNTWVYRHVRGGSSPGLPADWATSYSAYITAWRHSSATSFTFGTPVQESDASLGLTTALAAGVSSPGADSLIVLVSVNGRDNQTAFSATAPATGVSGGTVNDTSAPSTSAWYMRRRVSSGAATVGAIFDAVLDSGSTGAISVTHGSNTVGVNIGFSIQPAGGGPTPIAFSGTIPTIIFTIGTAGSVDLSTYFAGTETPFTFALDGASASLPGGVSLSSAALLEWTGTGAASTTPGFIVDGTDATPDTADSNSFSIVIQDALPPPSPPVITTQPSSSTVKRGQTATFTVAATGADSYQWEKNAGSGYADISGATSASYTTPATVMADNADLFRCKVTNADGITTSSAATLTVQQCVLDISGDAYIVGDGSSPATMAVANGYTWKVNAHVYSADDLDDASQVYSNPSVTAASSGKLANPASDDFIFGVLYLLTIRRTTGQLVLSAAVQAS